MPEEQNSSSDDTSFSSSSSVSPAPLQQAPSSSSFEVPVTISGDTVVMQNVNPRSLEVPIPHRRVARIRKQARPSGVYSATEALRKLKSAITSDSSSSSTDDNDDDIIEDNALMVLQPSFPSGGQNLSKVFDVPDQATIKNNVYSITLQDDDILDKPHLMLLPKFVRLSIAERPAALFDDVFERILRTCHVELRKSPIHGVGLFARKDFYVDQAIFPVFGTYFRRSTVLNPEFNSYGDVNLVAIPDDIKVAGESISLLMHFLCPARYINSQPANKANTDIQVHPEFELTDQLNAFRRHHGGLLPPELLWLMATKPIKKGEELTSDYEVLDDNSEEALPSSVAISSLLYP